MAPVRTSGICSTRGVGATILPALALRQGVPDPLRTLIAVPILLSSRAAIETQVERLEVHYLSSPDGELYFALLSDWTDAAQQNVPGDEALRLMTFRHALESLGAVPA